MTLLRDARLLARVRLAPGTTTPALARHAGYAQQNTLRALRRLRADGLVWAEAAPRGQRRWYPASAPLLLSHEERLVKALASAHRLEVAR